MQNNIILRLTALTCFLFSFLFLLACQNIEQPTAAEKPKTKLSNKQSLWHFVAFGDSGYIPSDPGKNSGLMPTANSMANLCGKQPCDFALMLGDNIYPNGATGNPQQDNPVFQKVFLDPFKKLAGNNSDFRIYAMLGNHDWYTSRNGAMAQVTFLENTPPFYMNGLFYSVRPPSANGNIEIFVIDTEMLLSKYELQRVRINDDGNVTLKEGTRPGGTANALPQTSAENNQLQWLEAALEASTAKWKIVAAHHPLWESNGNKHAQSTKLRELLIPMLCRSADAYFAGHQHTMEIHEYSCENFSRPGVAAPLPHIVSDAASKPRSVHPKYADYLERTYPQFNSVWAEGDAWGFVRLSLNDSTMVIDAYTTPAVKNSAETQKVFTATFKNRVD